MQSRQDSPSNNKLFNIASDIILSIYRRFNNHHELVITHQFHNHQVLVTTHQFHNHQVLVITHQFNGDNVLAVTIGAFFRYVLVFNILRHETLQGVGSCDIALYFDWMDVPDGQWVSLNTINDVITTRTGAV